MKLPEPRADGNRLEFLAQRVGFSLYPSDYIGQQTIPLQQPWSYAEFAIKNRELKAPRERETLAYLRQAKSFYDVARIAAEDSSPLLWYYCFLNLTKALLASNGEDLEALGRAVHGIGDPADNAEGYAKLTTQAIKTSGDLLPNGRLALFAHLCNRTGTPLSPGPQDIKVSDFIRQIPCIHRAYMQAYGRNSNFIKLRAPEFYECRMPGKRGEIWASFRLKKEDFSSSVTFKALRTQLEGLGSFKAVAPGDSSKTHAFEVGPFAYNHLGKKIAIRDLRRFLRLHVKPLVLPHGYLYYVCRERSEAYSLPAAIYAVMFYLGSVVRYHPYMFDKLIEKKYRWLINEFLQTAPKQFVILLINQLSRSQISYFEG